GVDGALRKILPCALGKAHVELEGDTIMCSKRGRRYPVREGMRVMPAGEAEMPKKCIVRMASIKGVGTDVVEVRRIEQALDRWGDAFVTRIFTIAEDERAKPPHARSARLAARFAAKEAVMKALGLGWRAMGW